MFISALASAASAASGALAAEHTARDARRTAGSAITSVDLMEADIERILMITEALWSFIKREHNLTDADLIRMLAEIDARDGRIDGRVASTPPTPCPHCSRMSAKHRPTCIYCGKPVIASPFQR